MRPGERERKMLQRVVALGAVVPVGAGLYGVLFGPLLTGDRVSIAGDSHYRYLSGLLLGIGLIYWASIPAIETRTGRFQLLTLVVAAGGLGRLIGVLVTGLPSLSMILALGMELVVTPVICLWQMRVARLFADEPTVAGPTFPAASS